MDDIVGRGSGLGKRVKIAGKGDEKKLQIKMTMRGERIVDSNRLNGRKMKVEYSGGRCTRYGCV